MAVSCIIATKCFSSIRALASDDSSKYKSLDALRGFLATNVFAYHAFVAHEYYHSGVWQSPDINMYRFAGGGSVSIFFMITGFLFWGKAIDHGIQPIALLRSRAKRIMPLYIFSCFLIFTICSIDAKFTQRVQMSELIQAIARWLAGGALGAPSINGASTLLLNAGVTWTLQYEWAFYAILPFLTIFTPPRRFLFLVFLYLLILTFFKLFGFANQTIFMLVAIPFLGGMFTAYITRHTPDVPKAKSWAASLFVLASLGVGAYYYKRGLGTIIAVGLIPSFILIALGNDLFGIMKTRWARWLGHISFSVYLLHGIVLLLALRALDLYWPIDKMQYSEYILWFMAISLFLVSICSGTYMLIELPSMKYSWRGKKAVGSGNRFDKAR